MSRSIHQSTALLIIILGTIILTRSAFAQEEERRSLPPGGLETNQSVIEGYRNNTIDLTDSLAVFRRLFSTFNDTVTVYPSENYYYFGFTAAGKHVMGSISLFPHERDSGRVGFGYTEKRERERWNEKDLAGGWGTFGEPEGVIVEKIDRIRYRVTCEGKSVVFRLHDLPSNQPPAGLLRPDEEFVLRNLDESGLGFLLLYNATMNRFYWVLDPEQPEVETFRLVAGRIAVGERSQFAFYIDSVNRRLVLIGVQGYNILNNNWYDGPFDQLPDNLIESGAFQLGSYIERSMPALKGRIDRFGHYLDNPGTRVAIAPYLVYYTDQELVDAVSACEEDGVGSSPHLTCMTQQVFRMPDDLAKAR